VPRTLFSFPIIKRGREDGDLCGLAVNLVRCNGKIRFSYFVVLFVFPSSYVPDLGDFHSGFSVFFGLGCIASVPSPHASVFVGLTPAAVVFVSAPGSSLSIMHVGGHKLQIFTTNITTFHLRYRMKDRRR
jgi:hypothetical protein